MRLKLASFILSVLCPVFALSQAPEPSPTPLPNNFIAAGLSGNIGADPEVAGTALYARKISEATGTYGITVIDALPVHGDFGAVQTSVGIGLAQKVFSIGKYIDIYTPAGAGLAWKGPNLSWSWDAGVAAAVPVYENWRIMPTLRWKSQIGNGGVRPILGILIGYTFK